MDSDNISYLLEKYHYVLYREPICGLAAENESFFRILWQFHESDSYKTQDDLEECERSELVATTEQLLNFHLFKFKGHPMDFTENIRKVVDEIEDKSFSAMQLKKKVYLWIKEIEEEFTPEEQNSLPETVETFHTHKLPWNASKSSLYHLFAQLLETHTKKKGNLLSDQTPESVAAFLLQSFSTFPILPDIKTITREIQKYRTLDGKPPEKSPPGDALRINSIDFDAD